MKESKKIKTLVVDDSALMRKMIPLVLEKDPGIEVVATAIDGTVALKKAEKYSPDVITLDIDMPGMDGLTTLRHIVRDYNTPVVIVSSISARSAEMAMKALEIGAMEVVAKPRESLSENMHEIGGELIRKVITASNTSPRDLLIEPFPGRKVGGGIKEKRTGNRPPAKVVAIGVSTGGPSALARVLSDIPASFTGAVLIAQHLPQGFTEAFAARLDKICRLRVQEASEGDRIQPGVAFLAPGGAHLKIKRTNSGSVAEVVQEPAVNGHRPSADLLLESVAEEYGPGAIGVIMTGMGEDGVKGLGEIKRAGGRTIAQDERSSVVFGMPKAAIESGYVDRVVPLNDLADVIMKEAESAGSSRATAN